MCGDPRGGPDGTRAPLFWLGTGAVLAVAGVAAASVLGMLRPATDLGDDPIVMDRGTGALYVRVDDVVHPVLNLTSARLVSGGADDPVAVSGDALTRVERGPTLGIPGAPDRIGPALEPDEATWTVCDGERTVVAAGIPVPAEASVGTVLVRGPTGITHLLFDGRRAVVDTGDPAVVRALHLDTVTPLTVSAPLLAVLPEAPPVAAPRIPGVGGPGPATLPGLTVGDVVRIDKAGGPELFVVLTAGVQRIGAVAADLIRFSAGERRTVPTLAPDALAGVPVVGTLQVADLPDRVDFTDPRQVCAYWADGAVSVSTGDELPGGITPTPLAQADGAGPAVDAVHLPPGRSLFVHPGVVITETGVRHGVDTEAARLLGLPEHPVAAPWSVVSALPEGPELTRAAALVQRDAAAAPR
jgi:type VII secretion protein EccB